jgi:hypothetical protein
MDTITKHTVEQIAMPAICAGWAMRAESLGLPKKGAKRDADREAYMQGALAALVAAGLMDVDRANQIAFLTAIGRLQAYMDTQAAKYVPQETTGE